MLNFIKKLSAGTFFRFSIIGGLGMVTNLLIFYVFTYIFLLNINISALIAFVAAVSQNYILNHFWTFKNYANGRPNLKDYIKYTGVNIFGLGINLIVLNALLYYYKGIEPLSAQFLGIAAGLLVNYSGSYVFVFAVNSSLSISIKKYISFFACGKKRIMALLLFSLFIFLVIWAGKTISVVTSREILEPLTIKIEGLNKKDLASLKVLSTLSRAGNTVSLARVPEKQNEWNNPYQTFIKKILIGFKKEQLDKLSSVAVSLGKENFSFNKKQFLNEWKKLDLTGKDLFLYDASGNSNYLIYEAPAKIKAKPLNIPGAPGIFASLNFNGSEKLIKQPALSSLKTFILAEALLLIFILLLFIYRLKNTELANNNDVNLPKKKFIVFGLSLAFTFLLLFILNILILHFYKPNTSQILQDASKIYLNATLGGFLPKPVERAQFIFNILLSPFLLLISYKFLKKIILKINSETTGRLYYFLSMASPLMLFAIAYIGLAVSNFFYINSSFSYGNTGRFLYSLLLFPIGAGIIISLAQIKNKAIKIFIYLFCSLLIIITALINIFPLSSNALLNDLSVPFHLDPVFYPMAQVMAGKTMLVNLPGLYGLYPVFLEPIFKLIGLSVLSFTSVMGIILGFSYLFIFLFLRKIIKNDIILWLGFSTIIFYFLENGGNPNPYFQYSPIRIFLPSLVLLMVSFYTENKNKFLYFFITLISALSVLWNLDSGIIVFIAWIATLCFIELFSENKKAAIKKIFVHIFFSLLALAFVFFAYAVYSFLRSGSLPELSLLWQYQKMFLAGYSMIPMPFPHVWVLAAVVFLAGLLLPIKNLLAQDKNCDKKNISIFFLSVLGLGLFTYYEGRSHDLVFYAPLYTVLALLAILTDIIYSNYLTNKKLYGSGLLFLTLLFFLLSSPINLIYNSGKYYGWVKSGLKSFTDQSSTMLTRNTDFIKSHTKKNESVIILSKNYYDGLFYGESKTRSVVDLPASTDIFFKREVEYLINFLKCNNDHKIFIYPSDDYYFYDMRINEIIKNDYIAAKKSDDNMALLIKNKKVDNCSNP